MSGFSPINFNAGYSNQNLSFERESVSGGHPFSFSKVFDAVSTIKAVTESNQAEMPNFLKEEVEAPYKEQFKVRTGYDALSDLKRFINELTKKKKEQ